MCRRQSRSTKQAFLSRSSREYAVSHISHRSLVSLAFLSLPPLSLTYFLSARYASIDNRLSRPPSSSGTSRSLLIRHSPNTTSKAHQQHLAISASLFSVALTTSSRLALETVGLVLRRPRSHLPADTRIPRPSDSPLVRSLLCLHALLPPPHRAARCLCSPSARRAIIPIFLRRGSRSCLSSANSFLTASTNYSPVR